MLACSLSTVSQARMKKHEEETAVRGEKKCYIAEINECFSAVDTRNF